MKHFIGMLAVALIVLKLCGMISWSWWLVTLPITLSIGLAVLAIAFVLVLAYVSK